MTLVAAVTARRVLVTGANKGIGKALCAAALEQYPDVHVLLGSRDAARGEQAVQSIVESTLSAAGRIEMLSIDVSDAESVAAAAKEVASRYGSDAPLFAICNNAGIGFGKGFGPTLATNYHGTRNVCEAFLPLLAPGGRLVNIASASAPMFVASCTEGQRRTFTKPDVTLADIEAVSERAVLGSVGLT
jgi:NAD(P)-dependent dehydrogenase (short-subunit alcohol dehydrogenase family)